MSAADRLIANRGHGLGERQRDLLAAVARGEVYQSLDDYAVLQPSDMGTRRTVVVSTSALHRLGLVALADEPSEPAIAAGERVWMWDVTTEGRTLLARMGGTP